MSINDTGIELSRARADEREAIARCRRLEIEYYIEYYERLVAQWMINHQNKHNQLYDMTKERDALRAELEGRNG